MTDTRSMTTPTAARTPRRHKARMARWLSVLFIVLLLIFIGLVLAKALMETYLYTQEKARQIAHEQLLSQHPLPNQYVEAIMQAAQENNVNPAFLAAIILCESSYRKDAESNVGARGLMQVMPDTAAWIADKLNEEDSYNFERMYDPMVNIRYGSWYIGYLSQRFGGDPILVASAYHAGQGEVSGWLQNSDYSLDGRTIRINDMIDGPTKQYAQRVVSAYAIYERLYFTKEEPAS